MEFFKPTRAKIITAILLLLFWWSVLIIRSFFVVSLGNLCLPSLTDELTPTPVPFNLRDTISDFSTITASHGFKDCSPYAPSYAFAYFIFSVSQIFLAIILAYLASCIVLSFLTTLKKSKKNYVVKSKK